MRNQTWTKWGDRFHGEVKKGKFSISRRAQVCRSLLDKELYPEGAPCLTKPNFSESFELIVGDVKINICRKSGGFVSYCTADDDILRDVTDEVAHIADDRLRELLGDDFYKIATN